MLKMLFALVPVFTFAQLWPMGSRSSALANASVALTDTWSFFQNPAAVSEINKISGGLYYENRFLIKELQAQGMVFNLPVKVGAISCGIQTFGFKYYRLLKAGLGYGFKLNDILSAGVQLSYQGLWYDDYYGNRQTVLADAGMLVKLNEKISIGTSVFNLSRSKVSRTKAERWSTDLRMGVTYQLSSKVLISGELNKNISMPLRVKFGIEYQPIKAFFLRTGLCSGPIEVAGGFGYRYKCIQLDFSTTYIPVLGFSPNLSFSFAP